ncbi:hypothetical protein SAMN05660226_02298 [Parapedobacter luteus]|uniref:Uncharacterized protein n=1 Tax=Parapedobacter luteus TaxID=623280 RepID=A0A1T5CSG1_9SPHI|nr:hypothetical protein [Parapedobacter luteus]SKB62409.1 hypothetical protein SAMN05660226_02298 [Parapedobacter luteus]
MQPFCRLQYEALQFHFAKGSDSLEDYWRLLGIDPKNMRSLAYEGFANKLEAEIRTHLRTAQNLGFVSGFVYRGG